ncbi:SRPBCC family protein [Mucilaginibacter sp.]
METINLTSIKKDFVVEASQQMAFTVFIEKMNLWWPRTHHIGSTEMTEIVVEPEVNGRWYTKHADGQEVNNGYVIKYDPYGLFVLAWQINGDFKYDPNVVTEIVAEFIPEGPTTTRVKFEHKDLHKLGSGKTIESMDKGWDMILNLFKQQAEL